MRNKVIFAIMGVYSTLCMKLVGCNKWDYRENDKFHLFLISLLKLEV